MHQSSSEQTSGEPQPGGAPTLTFRAVWRSSNICPSWDQSVAPSRWPFRHGRGPTYACHTVQHAAAAHNADASDDDDDPENADDAESAKQSKDGVMFLRHNLPHWSLRTASVGQGSVSLRAAVLAEP